jgi:hypothetical protein
MYTKKSKLKENWCPSDNDCNFFQRLIGCDVSDCRQPPTTCAIQTTQHSNAPNRTRFNELVTYLRNGTDSCLNTTNCTGDQIMSSLTPSLFPFDGRATGFHPGQYTNSANNCKTKYTPVFVDRGTYGGPGTPAISMIQAGHLPTSLSDVCFLLHDIMYSIAPSNKPDFLLHADIVLLHNLNYVKNALGEDPRNSAEAIPPFCLATRNGQGGTGFQSLIGNVLTSEDSSLWSETGQLKNLQSLLDLLTIVKAMKLAKLNGKGIIDNFGFFEELELGGAITLWSNTNYYNYYGRNSNYFAYEILNNYNRNQCINKLYRYIINMTEGSTGRWGVLNTGC